MRTEDQVIQTAKFNPSIKKYILFWVAFLMLCTVFGIPLLLFWFLGLGQHISQRYYENLQCELTKRHLKFKKGVMFRVEKTIPLENIQDLTFIDNPLLQYLDLRVLKIETAGNSNPQGSDMKLMGIVNAGDFKEAVLEQREELKDYGRNDSGRDSLNQENVSAVLLEIRDLLREIKEQKD
ncbi:MAG: PH domain-containing protein [Flavobacteriaceae bacterium]|nr:PH domain-containing protein [Flavobacteriaceae bacterium]